MNSIVFNAIPDFYNLIFDNRNLSFFNLATSFLTVEFQFISITDLQINVAKSVRFIYLPVYLYISFGYFFQDIQHNFSILTWN